MPKMSSNPVRLVKKVFFRSQEIGSLSRADFENGGNCRNAALMLFHQIKHKGSEGKKMLVFLGNMNPCAGKKRRQIFREAKWIWRRLPEFDANVPTKSPEGPRLVFVLGTAVFGNGNQTRRKMPKSNCGTCLVPFLPTGATCPVGVNFTLAKEELVLPGQPKLPLSRIQVSGF
jgi:hypothetical protein